MRRPSTSCPTPRTPPACSRRCVWRQPRRRASTEAIDVTSERAVLAVQGPDARRMLGQIWPEAAAVDRFNVADLRWHDVAVVSPERATRRGRGRDRRAVRRGAGAVASPAGCRDHPGGAGRPGYVAPRGVPSPSRPRARSGHHPAPGRSRVGGCLGQAELSGTQGARSRASGRRRTETACDPRRESPTPTSGPGGSP